MSNQNNDEAQSIINIALATGEIKRTDFNIARRAILFMSAETRSQWNNLNGAILHQIAKIIEDGDRIFDVPLSLDKSGRVIDTF